MVERTPDGRHIVVDGRRWRATDPSVPAALADQLVKALMAARRAVGAARRSGDEEAEARARRAVGDAKVALGERGEPWWEDPTPSGLQRRMAAAMRALLRGRDPAATICPSEVARIVGGDQWRDLMPVVRDVAADSSRSGEIEMRQRGDAVDPEAVVSGPIRLGRGRRFDDGW